MIPLPQKLRKNSFYYLQVLRGKNTCIYAQWYGEKLIACEVMKIRVRPGRYIKGKWIEAREKFPSDEDFGYYAWTYLTKDEAMEKYRDLEND